MISWGITPLYQVTMGKKMIFLCLHIQQGKQVSNGIHYHISPWYKAYIFLLPSNPKGLPRLFLRAGSSPDTIWKPENFVTGILPARFYWLLQSSIGGLRARTIPWFFGHFLKCPHAKIQLLLNTFKNGWKIKGSFLLWALQLM